MSTVAFVTHDKSGSCRQLTIVLLLLPVILSSVLADADACLAQRHKKGSHALMLSPCLELIELKFTAVAADELALIKVTEVDGQVCYKLEDGNCACQSNCASAHTCLPVLHSRLPQSDFP